MDRFNNTDGDPDAALMRQALAAAAQAIGLAEPNPRVGCVIASDDGRVLGTGHTQSVGSAHAEIMALRDAQARGNALAGATAYVTLEPCSHTGRTGPCCDALITAGLKRVVASIQDPNPLVGGQGFARLRAAGVTVEVGAGAHESRALNLGFFSRMLRARPWVRMKAAASLDGTTALDNGESQWITGQAARADGHAWRARACAVLTGIGTVLEDNPRLNVRLDGATRQPQLVVVDSRLQTPADAALFIDGRSVTIYAALRHPQREAELAARGARLVFMPGTAPHNQAKVDLRAMLADLARHEVNELHVEAGHKLNGSLMRESLVDEVLVYLAPKLLGRGRGILDLGPLSALDQAVELEFISSERVGVDLRVLARIAGRERF